MFISKEMKQKIVLEVAHDKKAHKERKKEISAMPSGDQKTARAKYKAERKRAATERKTEIREMPKDERKPAKKHDRVYKKVYNRPRRAIVWTSVLCVAVFLIILVAPIVGPILALFSIDLNSETPEGEHARRLGEIVAAEIADEGIVLLKNTDSFLPLPNGRINVFSVAANEIRFGGGGSGAADQTRAVDLYQGLLNAGLEYNAELREVYRSMGSSGRQGSTGLMQILLAMMGGSRDEPDISYLTDDIIAQARGYSDTALIVLASDGIEAADFEPEQLRLTGNRRDLVERVTANFENVIIVINAGNTMELGFLNEYPSIKAALWIGTPGPLGCNSLGRVLAGHVNPSGRLTSTYVYDVTSHPASVNFGDFGYSNIQGMSFINYIEGIYVGYRFFETFYIDDETGYWEAVQFPFGFGLSYTDFEWEIVDSHAGEDKIRLDVMVTNTGEIAGKDVVQVYFSAPFTSGGIEKSAIELAGYVKTGLLAPGSSQIVSVEFDTRDMASYDMHGVQAYVLEAGDYEIKLARNVHHIVDSIIYNVQEDVVYRTDDVTGTAIRNQFGFADGGLTYLSRSDWRGTYPDNTGLSFAAPQAVIDAHREFTNPPKSNAPLPVTGADNGIMLVDLMGLPYNDPMWQEFLDQFTVNEMKNLVIDGAYSTNAIPRLGVPASVLLDGPAGLNSFFSAFTAGSYPTAVVVASTWNDELAFRLGEAIGREANAYGVHGWYAPGMNIHRTPQGGRNYEYFSEDPLLSGKMSAAMVRGAQTRNVIVTMKHFILNDQETNARSGIFVWANEQAIREIYLRPFEITVKEAQVTGAMTSFCHIGYRWSGGSEELLKNVLRDEWGFVGLVTTDAMLRGYMDINLGIRNGNDLMLAAMPNGQMNYFNRLFRADPVGMTVGLRECVHNICYSLLNYTTLLE